MLQVFSLQETGKYLDPNIMRIMDISHRKTDSERTSVSVGVQGTCCQVSINPTYSQQSSDIVQLPAKVRATERYMQSDWTCANSTTTVSR